MSTSTHPAQNGPKKMSTSMVIITACLLGVVVGLFGLNYWHASRCGGTKSADELETYVEGINKRLLQAESLTIKNGIMMDKLLVALQSRLVELEATELEEITKQSQDEAVRLAILLAGQPAPPMPEFELDSKYKDAEKLADAVDDVFGSLDSSKDDFKNDKEPWENYDDTEYPSSKKSAKVEPSETLTDAEALKLCSEWKEKYSVVVGVSWGNLPYDLQQRWLKISCDYHFANDKDKEK